MPKITPDSKINEYLRYRGYKPVEKDVRIHELYLCILHFNTIETICGDCKGRRGAIINAIVEAEDHPAITFSRVSGWVGAAYGKVGQ